MCVLTFKNAEESINSYLQGSRVHCNNLRLGSTPVFFALLFARPVNPGVLNMCKLNPR